jgi:hypothetical protein
LPRGLRRPGRGLDVLCRLTFVLMRPNRIGMSRHAGGDGSALLQRRVAAGPFLGEVNLRRSRSGSCPILREEPILFLT